MTKASERALSNKPKTLLQRTRPEQVLLRELCAQLAARGTDIDTTESIQLKSSRKSQLESFLWRDIEHFSNEGYEDHIAITKALRRLRENSLFIETVNELAQEFS